jgi:hypothetical protein
MTRAAPRPQLAHLTAALNDLHARDLRAIDLRARGTLDHALETMGRVARRMGILQ